MEPRRRTIDLSTINEKQRTDQQRITAIGLPSNNHSIVKEKNTNEKENDSKFISW